MLPWVLPSIFITQMEKGGIKKVEEVTFFGINGKKRKLLKGT